MTLDYDGSKSGKSVRETGKDIETHQPGEGQIMGDDTTGIGVVGEPGAALGGSDLGADSGPDRDGGLDVTESTPDHLRR